MATITQITEHRRSEGCKGGTCMGCRCTTRMRSEFFLGGEGGRRGLIYGKI